MATVLPKRSTEIIHVELQGFFEGLLLEHCAHCVVKSSSTFLILHFFCTVHVLKICLLCSQSFSKYVKDVKRVSAKADKR